MDFHQALAEYVVTHYILDVSGAEIAHQAEKLFAPLFKVNLYHKACFWLPDFCLFRNNWQDYDVVQA